MTKRIAPMTPPLAAPDRSPHHVGSSLLGRVGSILTRRPSSHDSPPAGRPAERDPAMVDPIDRYRRDAGVWAYIGGKWLTGTVADVTGGSALIAYTVPGTDTTLVETVHPTGLHLLPTQGPDSSPSSGAPCLSDAGQARAMLDLHSADEYGICKGCADLALFRSAPCPQAMTATATLGLPLVPPLGAE